MFLRNRVRRIPNSDEQIYNGFDIHFLKKLILERPHSDGQIFNTWGIYFLKKSIQDTPKLWRTDLQCIWLSFSREIDSVESQFLTDTLITYSTWFFGMSWNFNRIIIISMEVWIQIYPGTHIYIYTYQFI